MDKPKKFGRPSKYLKKYCQELIDHCAMGLSLESFAATVGCCRETLWEWKKKHKDFFHAIKCAKEAHLLETERQLVRIIRGGRGNISGAIFSLKCKHQWKEEVTEEISNDPIQIEIVQRQ